MSAKSQFKSDNKPLIRKMLPHCNQKHKLSLETQNEPQTDCKHYRKQDGTYLWVSNWSLKGKGWMVCGLINSHMPLKETDKHMYTQTWVHTQRFDYQKYNICFVTGPVRITARATYCFLIEFDFLTNAILFPISSFESCRHVLLQNYFLTFNKSLSNLSNVACHLNTSSHTRHLRNKSVQTFNDRLWCLTVFTAGCNGHTSVRALKSIEVRCPALLIGPNLGLNARDKWFPTWG